MLSTEEKQILKDGEYYNRRGYYKFLKSKKLERLNKDLLMLEQKVNGAWNTMDLQTSDQYEKMPKEFQNLISKVHPRIKDMIKFWEKFVIFREKAETPNDKIYEFVFTKIDLNCEICYSPFNTVLEI